MGTIFRCAVCLLLWFLLLHYFSQLMNSNCYLLLLAMIGATVVVSNIHACIDIVQNLMCSRQMFNETAAPDSAGYDYGFSRGPHTWQAADNNQSPVNISTACAEQVCFDRPLIWRGYEQLPAGIRLENNGHTLLLRAAFRRVSPYIDGADLLGCFNFYEISFRWSWYNGTGSEHTVDNEHFPLEIQCLHTDAVNNEHASSRGLLMVSYMYSVSEENPFLDVLIQHLVAVQVSGQIVEIPPFPLNYLMPAFYTDFYSYHGSLTEPPCHRGAEWFIYPLPLAISERQLHEFRKLRSRRGGRIGRNARPVQQLGDRIVKINRYQSPR